MWSETSKFNSASIDMMKIKLGYWKIKFLFPDDLKAIPVVLMKEQSIASSHRRHRNGTSFVEHYHVVKAYEAY